MSKQKRQIYHHLVGKSDDEVADYFWMLHCGSSPDLSPLGCVSFSIGHHGNEISPFQSTYIVECAPADNAHIILLDDVLNNVRLLGYTKTRSVVKARRVWEVRSGPHGRFAESGAFLSLIRDNEDMLTSVNDHKFVVP
jgi:hypothetical protein